MYEMARKSTTSVLLTSLAFFAGISTSATAKPSSLRVGWMLCGIRKTRYHTFGKRVAKNRYTCPKILQRQHLEGIGKWQKQLGLHAGVY